MGSRNADEMVRFKEAVELPHEIHKWLKPGESKFRNDVPTTKIYQLSLSRFRSHVVEDLLHVRPFGFIVFNLAGTFIERNEGGFEVVGNLVYLARVAESLG